MKKEIGNNNFSFETLNKLFYIKGIAEKVLSTSLDNFRKSINILKEIGIESEWLTVNLDMYETINNYLHITKGYIKILYKKLEVKKTERPSQKFINYETINKSYISKGLEFIKKDFDSNYVDLKHYMYLGELDDFCNENDVHESDTFQRTILNDCLLDILIKENSLDQNYFYSKRIPRGSASGSERKSLKNGWFFIKLKITSLPLNTSRLCLGDYLFISWFAWIFYLLLAPISKRNKN